MNVVLRRTVVGSGDWRFDNLSGSHDSQVNSSCQSNVPNRMSSSCELICRFSRNVIGCKTQVA